MSVEVHSQGIDQSLKRLAGQQKKAERKAVKAAAEYYADKLVAETPVFDDKKYKGNRGSYMIEHAKDHIVFGKFKDGIIPVGFDDEVAWRVHFVEFGTIKQQPNGFMERTQQSTQREVVEIMERAIRRELGL